MIWTEQWKIDVYHLTPPSDLQENLSNFDRLVLDQLKMLPNSAVNQKPW